MSLLAPASYTGSMAGRGPMKPIFALLASLPIWALAAHPTAADQLRKVAEGIAARFEVHAIAAVHRVGDLAIGDLAVVVAVSSSHRATAFEACRALIDELKETVPIWKHQRFTGGDSEWVNSA